MTPSKLVIAAFALSATAVMAHGNKQTSAQSSSNQASNAATQSADGASGANLQQDESTVKQAQQALNDKGFNVGSADGIAGPKTQAGVKKFQQSQSIGASGQLDQQTLAALGVQTAPDMTLGKSSSSQPSQASQSSTSPTASPGASDTSQASSASSASSPASSASPTSSPSASDTSQPSSSTASTASPSSNTSQGSSYTTK